MKQIYPDYYREFQCIADRCQHNCCIGWEIDIDEETYRLYQQIDGELGLRLQQQVQKEDTPHFRLGEGERCPFLNRQNLCDIILELGEDSLCQICTDHPRFRNFYTNFTEIGLGLCCEAAGQLILSREAPFLLPEIEDSLLTEAEKNFFLLRKRLLNIAQNREVSLKERIRLLCRESGAEISRKSREEWVAIFLELEQLDPAWSQRLQALSQWNRPAFLEDKWDIPLEQLLCYFLYRHLSDGIEEESFAPRILFAVLGTCMVAALASVELEHSGCFSMEQLIEIVRLYSSEIEYSEENTQKLLEILQ